MNYRGGSALKVIVIVAGCALMAMCLLGEFWRLTPSRPDMSTSATKALAIFTDRARDALGPFPDPDEDNGNVMVQLFFLPSSVKSTDVKVTGVNLRVRLRTDMRGWCNPPYDCYTLSFIGHVDVGATPSSAYNGTSFPLQHEAGRQGSKSEPFFWWNDSTVPFFSPTMGDTNAFAVDQIPESCARAFKPAPGERTADVWATGRPAFEADRFKDGLWAGSYVVWHTEDEAKAGDLTKTPTRG